MLTITAITRVTPHPFTCRKLLTYDPAYSSILQTVLQCFRPLRSHLHCPYFLFVKHRKFRQRDPLRTLYWGLAKFLPQSAKS